MTPAPLTLGQSADLLGRYRYVELAAFGAVGARATGAHAPQIVRYLAGAAAAHGWRARQIEERLPVSVGLPGTEECTRSPSVIVDQAIALAVEPGSDDEVVAALVAGLYPAMADAYRDRMAAASWASDAPVVRAIGRVLDDLEAVMAEGAALIDGGLTSGRVERVIRLLSDVGGPFGPLVEHLPFTD